MSDEAADIPEILHRPAVPGRVGSRAAALLGGGETAAAGGMTLGEVIYDRVSIDPHALAAFQFAHKPADGDIYRLASWAHTTLVGPSGTVEGRINRLQGYVFERVAAAALRQGGCVVELPASATNPGWDLLVNGEKVQAKCGHSPNLVYEHFHRYPGIQRVVVNEELASHFQNDDRVVAIGGVTHDFIHGQTERSLHAASDMLDLSMVQFVPVLSTIRNGWAWWKGATDTTGLLQNVAVDGAARYLGVLAAGKVVGFAVTSVLIGGWPAVLAPVFGSVAGYRGGRAVAGLLKRHVLLRSEAIALERSVVAWCMSCARVLGTMVEQATAAGDRFRAARERAGAAWAPLMDDWLGRLEAEQAYRNLLRHRFERAVLDLGALGGEPGPLGTAGAAMLTASRAGILPSDLPSERKALVAAAEAYGRGLRRRLLS